MQQASNYLPLILLRFLSDLGGLALIAMAIFLYETEDKQVQSHLEDWWIHLDDASDQIQVRLRSFLSTAVQLWIRGTDTLFGQRIVGVQAAAVSSCLSWSSVLFVLTVFLLRPSMESTELAPYVDIVLPKTISWLLIFVVLSLAPMVFRNSPRARKALSILGLGFSLVSALSFAALISLILIDMTGGDLTVAIYFSPSLFGWLNICILAGIASNILFLAVNRWIFLTSLSRVVGLQDKRAGIGSSLWLPISFMVGMSLVVIGVVFPLYSGVTSLRTGQASFFVSWSQLVVGLMNVPVSLAFAVLILIILLLLVHNAVWPLPTRLLYFVVRHKLIEKKWTLWVAGTSMLAFAVPSVGELAKHLEKLLGLR